MLLINSSCFEKVGLLFRDPRKLLDIPKVKEFLLGYLRKVASICHNGQKLLYNFITGFDVTCVSLFYSGGTGQRNSSSITISSQGFKDYIHMLRLIVPANFSVETVNS